MSRQSLDLTSASTPRVRRSLLARKRTVSSQSHRASESNHQSPNTVVAGVGLNDQNIDDTGFGEWRHVENIGDYDARDSPELVPTSLLRQLASPMRSQPRPPLLLRRDGIPGRSLVHVKAKIMAKLISVAPPIQTAGPCAEVVHHAMPVSCADVPFASPMSPRPLAALPSHRMKTSFFSDGTKPSIPARKELLDIMGALMMPRSEYVFSAGREEDVLELQLGERNMHCRVNASSATSLSPLGTHYHKGGVSAAGADASIQAQTGKPVSCGSTDSYCKPGANRHQIKRSKTSRRRARPDQGEARRLENNVNCGGNVDDVIVPHSWNSSRPRQFGQLRSRNFSRRKVALGNCHAVLSVINNPDSQDTDLFAANSSEKAMYVLYENELQTLEGRLVSAEETVLELNSNLHEVERLFAAEVGRLKRILSSVDQAQELRYHTLLEVFTDNFKTMGQVEARFEDLLGVRHNQMQTSTRGRLMVFVWTIIDVSVRVLCQVLHCLLSLYCFCTRMTKRESPVRKR
jgi:hypothetical protein